MRILTSTTSNESLLELILFIVWTLLLNNYMKVAFT
jgi:hypothetical protein